MKCNNCGTAVDSDAKQCPGCGAVFESEVDHPAIRSRVPISLLGTSLGALVVVIIWFLFANALLALTIGAAVALLVWGGGTIIR